MPAALGAQCSCSRRAASCGRAPAARASSHADSASSSVPFIRAQGSPVLAPRISDMSSDPYGLLLSQRTIVLGGEVSDFSADAIIAQLLMLDAKSPGEDIKLFINSPGGSVTAGMGVYDAMNLCRSEVQTYCFGLAASMGAFLLGAGRKGKRHSMPNARIMIHQPLGGVSGQAIDVEIQAREMMYHATTLNRIMSEYTGQTIEQIEIDTDRDNYMSPLEAKHYGIIDHVVGGDDAGYQMEGSTLAFTKRRLSQDTSDNPNKTRGHRFRDQVEPYMLPLYPEEKKEDKEDDDNKKEDEEVDKKKDEGSDKKE